FGCRGTTNPPATSPKRPCTIDPVRSSHRAGFLTSTLRADMAADEEGCVLFRSGCFSQVSVTGWSAPGGDTGLRHDMDPLGFTLPAAGAGVFEERFHLEANHQSVCSDLPAHRLPRRRRRGFGRSHVP